MAAVAIKEALTRAVEDLKLKGIDTARIDAEVLLAFVLKISRTDLYIKSEELINEDRLAQFFSIVSRRGDREPVAYLTGEREFMSLSFVTNKNVLIPRPETEILVEEALAIKPLRIIDVGTGSGAIAVSLAHYLPECRVWAVDISSKALAVARLNANRHGVEERISFYQGDLLAPLSSSEFFGSFDLITANLPYIPTPEIDNLPIDVRGFEPLGALDGGVDGLKYYCELGLKAFELLIDNGVILLEVGYSQASQIRDALENWGFRETTILRDLAGIDRIVKAVK